MSVPTIRGRLREAIGFCEQDPDKWVWELARDALHEIEGLDQELMTLRGMLNASAGGTPTRDRTLEQIVELLPTLRAFLPAPETRIERLLKVVVSNGHGDTSESAAREWALFAHYLDKALDDLIPSQSVSGEV